jgi:uncharacterized membrane protein YeaQ/YmgE (transglycosylase-associated protein family)
MLLDIIWWLVTGLIVGALARFLLPGRDPMGCLVTALLGIAGSFVGGFIGSLIWGSARGRFQPGGFLLSLVGAIILLWLWRRFRR